MLSLFLSLLSSPVFSPALGPDPVLNPPTVLQSYIDHLSKLSVQTQMDRWMPLGTPFTTMLADFESAGIECRSAKAPGRVHCYYIAAEDEGNGSIRRQVWRLDVTYADDLVERIRVR